MVTSPEFRALTDLVGKVIARNFPGLTFAVVITDGVLVNVASNARSSPECIELLVAAFDQVEKQPAISPLKSGLS